MKITGSGIGRLVLGLMVLGFGVAGGGSVPAYAATYSHGDACTNVGAVHQKDTATHYEILVCDGAAWRSAASFGNNGNLLRMDNNPGGGGSGCFRYDGVGGRMQYSHDCAIYNDFTNNLNFWTGNGAGTIYFNSGTTRVGIGTGSPATTLDVNGTMTVRGQLQLTPVGSAAAPAGLGLQDFSNAQFTFTSAGNFGIGAPSPAARLHVVGDIVYTGMITDISDARLKQDIAPLDGSEAKIAQLQPVSYHMKDSPQRPQEMGFIAQQIETVYPTLVKTDAAGIKSVNYIGLIAPLVQAHQEQQQTIRDLQARIEMLEKQLDALPASSGER